MPMSDPSGSAGLGSFGHSVLTYCMGAGHYSWSPRPAVLTENSASEICSDPI